VRFQAVYAGNSKEFDRKINEILREAFFTSDEKWGILVEIWRAKESYYVSTTNENTG
jgi:hypothetical protein